MSILDALEKRRSYYKISKKLPVSQKQIGDLVCRVTELVPDAFNMKSARIVLLFGAQHDLLWDTVYNVFGGKVAREKIDIFKSGAGTILCFYDAETVKNMQAQFPRYAENFPVWANQAGGMLQISLWSALRELNIGASLQHYNPVIDDAVKKLFKIPENYVLLAQMPFGGIVEEPQPKAPETPGARVRIIS
ncbi:MAG: nitroreductase family protein [Pyramidobacter sp.]|jgi:predicted oxidoreductase (fatty acid repression mutant protein)